MECLDSYKLNSNKLIFPISRMGNELGLLSFKLWFSLSHFILCSIPNRLCTWHLGNFGFCEFGYLSRLWIAFSLRVCLISVIVFCIIMACLEI